MKKRKKSRKTRPNRQKSAVFSTRMEPDLRQHIEQSAKRHDSNVSREVSRLLRMAFAIEKKQDPRLRAIAYLMGQVALFTGDDWKTDPWMFRAFQTAVFALIDKLAPAGDPKPHEIAKQVVMRLAPVAPEQLKNIKPEGFGYVISELVWKTLTTMIRPPGEMNVPSGSWPHAMPQVREDLDIDFDEQSFFAIVGRKTTNNDGGVK